jgi:membrane-bound serine protease (ClpP class)
MATLAFVRSLVLTLSMFMLSAPSVCAEDQPPTATHEPAAAARPLLDRVAEFFREPIVYVALIALGLVGLIFEVKFPGSTFPGSVAALCFVLFFWSHSFVGHFTLLAILLFLLGLVFLGIEVFVVPGLCFSGVAGVVLMFLGLILVTLDHWPAGADDWTSVGSTFGSLAIGMALSIVGALTLTWSLPSIPFLNRMVLKPPPEETEIESAKSLSNSGTRELLGAMGVVVTPLRPSGKAQFGGQFLDVIAEGDYVAPGVRVQVIEIEGLRVVVKEI